MGCSQPGCLPHCSGLAFLSSTPIELPQVTVDGCCCRLSEQAAPFSQGLHLLQMFSLSLSRRVRRYPTLFKPVLSQSISTYPYYNGHSSATEKSDVQFGLVSFLFPSDGTTSPVAQVVPVLQNHQVVAHPTGLVPVWR